VYHTIQFAAEFVALPDISPTHHRRRALIRKGDRLKAQVHPYVTETDEGPVEVADLFFEDGTTTRRVPFAYFAFVE
jgi:hypothetical protein